MKTIPGFLVLSALMAAVPASGWSAKKATLEVIEGKVQVMQTGKNDWQPVEPRGTTDLTQGDRVRTSNKARAVITLDDASKIELQPSSVFLVDFLEEKNFRFKLDFGRLKAFVSKIRVRQFSVITPTAVCAVRGTEFEVNVDPSNQHTQVSVLEGLVAVADNKGSEMLLKAGESVSVTVDGLGNQQGAAGDQTKDKKDDKKDEKAKQEITREVRLDMTREAIEAAAALEMKNAVAQDGKTLIDAFGLRVRAESYIVRPTADSISWVTLNTRDQSFNFSRWDIYANKALPDQLGSGFLGSLYSKPGTGAPEYWATKSMWFMSNTKDYWIDAKFGGNPVKLCTVAGCGSGSVWWETIFDHTYVAVSDAGQTHLLTHLVPGTGVKGSDISVANGFAAGNVYQCVPSFTGSCLTDPVASGDLTTPFFYKYFESADAGTTVGDQGGPGAGTHLNAANTLDALNTAYSGQEGYFRTAKFYMDGKDMSDPSFATNFNDALKLRFTTEVTYCLQGSGSSVCSATLAKTSDNKDIKLTYDDYVIHDEGNAFTVADLKAIFSADSNNIGNANSPWKKFAERANYEFVTQSSSYGSKIDLVIPMRILNQLNSSNDNRPSS
ncbi:MAG: FecR domain-containing protein [Elusimicrobia bacterium]|nr:FecR domain-containing protein [Elusimicrobiota bacterium]